MPLTESERTPGRCNGQTENKFMLTVTRLLNTVSYIKNNGSGKRRANGWCLSPLFHVVPCILHFDGFFGPMFTFIAHILLTCYSIQCPRKTNSATRSCCRLLGVCFGWAAGEKARGGCFPDVEQRGQHGCRGRPLLPQRDASTLRIARSTRALEPKCSAQRCLCICLCIYI